MSAFVMDEQFFNQLASELFAHAALKQSKLNWPVTYVLDLRGDDYSDAEKRLQQFVRDCYCLNVAAVNSRYKEDNEPAPLHFTKATGLPKWSDEQLFKHLECVSYQCAEDVAEMSTTYGKLEKLIGHVARAIVGASDKYEAANWDYKAA
jgi:hypothetical protein